MLPFQDGGRDFRVGATVAVRRSLAMKNETAPKKATVETCLTGYVFVWPWKAKMLEIRFETLSTLLEFAD